MIPTTKHAINTHKYWFAHPQSKIEVNLISKEPSSLSKSCELPQI